MVLKYNFLILAISIFVSLSSAINFTALFKEKGLPSSDKLSFLVSTSGLNRHWHAWKVAHLVPNATILLKCPLTSLGSNIVWMHSIGAPTWLIDNSSSGSQAAPVLSKFPRRLFRQLNLGQPPASLLTVALLSPNDQIGYYWCQSRVEIVKPRIRAVFRLDFDSENRLSLQAVPISASRVAVAKLRQVAVSALAGSSVALPCGPAQKSNRFLWTRDGELIIDRRMNAGHSTVSNCPLVVGQAQPADSGLYTSWLVDNAARGSRAIVAQWNLLVLPVSYADAAAASVGMLELECSDRLGKAGEQEIGIERPGRVGDGRCLVTWSTVSPAAGAVRLAATTRDSWSFGEQRVRRSVRNVHNDGSLPPHQHLLANLRILSETGLTVRVAWDLPDPDSCLSIELRIHWTVGKRARSSATSASCSTSHADMSVQPGAAVSRLSASIVSPDGRTSPPAELLLNIPSPSSAGGALVQKPTGLLVWSGRDGVVHVAWQPPRRPVEGKVADYVVAYGPVSATTPNVEQQRQQLLTVAGVEYQLRNLPAKRRFAVRVAARAVSGAVGPYTDWLQFGTVGNSDYRSALISPNSPQSFTAPNEAIADQLRIRDLLPLGKRDSILLSWTRPSRVQPDKYIISYGTQHPKEHQAGEISGDQDSFQIRNLEPNTRYFISISAIKGEIHISTPIEAKTLGSKDDPGYMHQPPQVPMAVKVQLISSRNVSVSWTDPQLGLPGLEFGRRIYEVEWSFDTVEQAQSLPQPQVPSFWRLNTSELSVRLSGLRPSTAYSVRVRCLAIAADLTAVPSEFSMRAVFSTLPEPPGGPPRDLKVSRSTLPMSVMLSWLPPLKPNGKITKYTVLYRPLNSNAGSEHATGTTETQVVITGLKPSTHYYFRVRAGNSEGFGPDSGVVEFMMPDSSGQGGGVVYNTDSVLQRGDSSSGADSDGLSSQRWWLLIGGIFGFALLLLATSTAVVCMCQQRRPRRSELGRAAKESASLIGGPEQLQQPMSPPTDSQQSFQSPPGPLPGMLSTASPLSMPPTSSALLAGHQLQHQLQHQFQLHHHHQQQQQQLTPDLCRHADFELRAMAMMPMQLPPPPPTTTMLLESGPAPNQPVAGHFRNLSNSGSGSYPQHQQLQQQQQVGAPRLGSVVSPPRVDAPDFSSPGKLSSPHSSLSSSIGSASKQRHAAAAASGGPLMSTSAHSRPYPAPDILNPAPGHRQHQIQDQLQHQHHPHQHQQQQHQHQLRNSHATIGSLTLESQNSQNFTLSTEDMDMAKTLDGLIQDLKGLTTREFEC